MSVKFTNNIQMLPSDATGSMEMHGKPATITFNIEIQSLHKFRYYIVQTTNSNYT